MVELWVTLVVPLKVQWVDQMDQVDQVDLETQWDLDQVDQVILRDHLLNT